MPTTYIITNAKLFKMDITITYRLKQRFKSHNHICVSVCNRYFNTQKNTEIFIKKNGGSRGIWLDRRTFIIESKIAENLEDIPKYKYIPNDFLTNL